MRNVRGIRGEEMMNFLYILHHSYITKLSSADRAMSYGLFEFVPEIPKHLSPPLAPRDV